MIYTFIYIYIYIYKVNFLKFAYLYFNGEMVLLTWHITIWQGWWII